MAIIKVTALVSFDYDTDDGLVTTPEEAIEDMASTLPSLSPDDFIINYEVDDE